MEIPGNRRVDGQLFGSRRGQRRFGPRHNRRNRHRSSMGIPRLERRVTNHLHANASAFLTNHLTTDVQTTVAQMALLTVITRWARRLPYLLRITFYSLLLLIYTIGSVITMFFVIGKS